MEIFVMALYAFPFILAAGVGAIVFDIKNGESKLF